MLGVKVFLFGECTHVFVECTHVVAKCTHAVVECTHVLSSVPMCLHTNCVLQVDVEQGTVAYLCHRATCGNTGVLRVPGHVSPTYVCCKV